MNFFKKYFEKFKNVKKLQYVLIVLLILILLFFILIKVYGGITGFWDIGYQINDDDSGEIYVGGIEGIGACHKVSNISGISYFIPTKTTDEWNAFDSNKPANVFISSCCADTCASEGHECGTYTICDVSTDCGTCGVNADCSFGNCVCDSGFADCNNNNNCDCNTNTHHCLAGGCILNAAVCVPNAGNSCGTTCTPGTINCSGTCITHNANYGISCGAGDEICDGAGSCCDPIYTPDMCPADWCGSYDNGCNGMTDCGSCPLSQECNFLTGKCIACVPEPCSLTSDLYCEGAPYDDSCGNPGACIGTDSDCDCDSCYTQDDCPVAPTFCGTFNNPSYCVFCGALQGVDYPDTVICGDCTAYGNNNWYCGSGYECDCTPDLSCPLSGAYCNGTKYYSNCGSRYDDNTLSCLFGPCCTGTHQACTDPFSKENYCGTYTDTICDVSCSGTKLCDASAAAPTYCVSNNCCMTSQTCDKLDVCAGTYVNYEGCSDVTCTSAACEAYETCAGDSLCHANCTDYSTYNYSHGYCVPYESTSYCCCDGSVIEAWSCP